MEARNIGFGALAGLAGGLVFGVMMHMTGMIAMVGALIGIETVGAGWAVHLVNSAIIGAIYALTFGAVTHDPTRGAGFGAAYGAIWWVLGALLIMPLWLGMPVFQLGQPQIMSLVGHLLYGVITGLVYYGLVHEAVPTRA